MQSVNLAIAVLLLSAGSSAASELANTPESIAAFRDICLKTAPSFAGAEKAAQEHGITEIVDAGAAGKSGFTADQSLGIQLKENECVVTTAASGDKALTKQLLAAVSEFLGVPVGKKTPALITIEGQSFILLHDRDDGEAFVLLKKK